MFNCGDRTTTPLNPAPMADAPLRGLCSFGPQLTSIDKPSALTTSKRGTWQRVRCARAPLGRAFPAFKSRGEPIGLAGMELTPPHERERTVGRAEIEADLRSALEAGRLSNGWMVAGPKGAGKATLAYRLARGILDPGGLASEGGLFMDPKARTFRLVAARGHPDLFVAEKSFDDKNERYATEITVETIRELSSFLSKTAAFGGWRVAIVDAADELNRNAANALLKSLEEPPQRTLVLLVANEPGRLLPTIRSRCRRIDLKPLPDAEIASLLSAEAGLDPAGAAAIASVSTGDRMRLRGGMTSGIVPDQCRARQGASNDAGAALPC
ncbi:MAG: AAA family ATPase, partial [Parvularculaceae bacterium]